MQSDIRQRVADLDWERISQDMDSRGAAPFPALLTPQECADLAQMYRDDTLFRSRIDMARYSFGEGEYKYFSRPLPPLVDALREAFYPHLAATANRWARMLNDGTQYPETLEDFLAYCHAHGQTRPTPLLLHYDAGGYNCLHQDIYGQVAFPLQVVFLLSRPGQDFTGGELLLVEQRPRAQSQGTVYNLEQGGGLVFTTRHRPIRGRRGYYRGTMRHGVSVVRSGERYTLGIIFHDAA